jgi:two-component system sensor histidine kinase/response regulator
VPIGGARAIETGPDTPSRSTQVVIADLDANFREQARDQLAVLRLRPILLPDRAELEQLLSAPETGPAILITDVRLAGGDVRGFIERLRASGRDRDVIVTTGYLTMDAAVMAVRAGAFDMIQKPPVWPRVLRTVEILLADRAHRRPQPPVQPRAAGNAEDLATGLLDIRLGAIPAVGFLGLLEDGDLGPLTSNQREALDAIRAGLDWIIRRISVHLDHSTGRTTGPILRPEPIDVSALVYWAVEMFRPMSYGRHVELTYSCPEPLMATIDRDALVVILFALLENAVRTSLAGTEVEVSVSADDGRVVVAITDQGPTISPDVAERVFETGFEIPGRESPEGGSALAAAHVNALMMGAHLSFDSNPAVGTTFRVSVSSK